MTILQDPPNTIVRCAAVKALSKAAPADLANAAEALGGCGLGDSDKNLRLASGRHSSRCALATSAL